MSYNETLSLVLIVVGTLALIYMLKGSSCGGGESYHKHSASCGCPQGIIGAGRDGIIGARRDGIIGARRDGIIGARKGARDSFASSYVPNGDISANYAELNYQDAIKDMALEKDVQKSHKKFIGEIQHRTTGASLETVRDDRNDVNGWVARPPMYRTRAQPGKGARVITSEIPSKMRDGGRRLTF